MTDQVRIFDTTLRDGEQAPGYSMNIEEKVRMAQQLERLGVDVLEAGFAIASPGDFESVRRIAETVKTPVVASLCRALEKDIDAAYEAVKGAVRPRIHTFLATSDLHLQYKLRMTREQALERAVEAVKYARRRCEDVEFSLEDASRTDFDYMCRIVEAVIAAGATTVNLPDTVGYATPGEIAAMVTNVRTRVPNVDRAVISMHVHDDLGLAVANSLAGIAAGARQVECCVCGIGERAGNAALEEIVMNLRTRHDVYGVTCGVRTDRPHREAAQHDYRREDCAEQGDCRRQRLRARIGHPPARSDGEREDVRNHDAGKRGAQEDGARAGQALGPARLCAAARRAGLHGGQGA